MGALSILVQLVGVSHSYMVMIFIFNPVLVIMVLLPLIMLIYSLLHNPNISKTMKEFLVVISITLGIVMILAAGSAWFSDEFLPTGIISLIIGVVLLAVARVFSKKK